MNTKIVTIVLFVLWQATGVCFADRPLDRPEILNILQSLTAEPHKTWIPAGTIVATHEEYKAKSSVSNEYRMNTNVIVRFDGERFYWQIDVIFRTDLTGHDPNLANNIANEQFDLNANGSRIFAWDGQKYSTYFRPINNAVIKDAAKNKIPPVVNGPLTAGFIPWGYGYYTYEKLSAATSRGAEMAVEGQRQIQLTLGHPNGFEMIVVLDPDRNYAVLSHSVKKADGSTAVNTYGNFLQIGGKWIPTIIMLEQYNNFVAPQNLTASDMWNFTSIDNNVLAEESFTVNYDTDALVEYHNSITAKPVIYRYSKAAPASRGINTNELLIDKFESDAAGNGQSKNCATAAIKYAASKLDKNVTDQQLAQLLPASGGYTSLYALKQFTQGLGLYCRAVKTDVQTLRSLTGCQAILHLAGKKHYVVLGNIDDKYVRVIDLSSRKFFERFGMSEFGEEWTGTALLISNQPINGQLTDIDDVALQNILGTGYACNKLLQEYNVVGCSYIGGGCGGLYKEYYERWGCGAATSGTCSPSVMVRYDTTQCIVDPYDPLACTITGEWIDYYMRACI